MKTEDTRIANEYQDGDGYWIELIPGWCVDGCEHGICEESKIHAKARMADVMPCTCPTCVTQIEAGERIQ